MSASGRRCARLVIAALTVGALLAPVPPAAAEDGPPRKIRDSAEATVDCRFDQVGDLVRVSTSRGRREAVGHGWWRNRTCPPAKATVTVEVEARVDGRWRTVGHEGKVQDSSGGKVKRARGCAFCEGTRSTQWRSVIDVDLDDHDDDRDKLYTPAVRIRCGAPT